MTNSIRSETQKQVLNAKKNRQKEKESSRIDSEFTGWFLQNLEALEITLTSAKF